MITTLTGKNQVTVPAAIAAKAGLRPGMRLEWELKEDGLLEVRILPDRATLASNLRGRGRRLQEAPGGAVERLVDERAREAEAEA